MYVQLQAAENEYSHLTLHYMLESTEAWFEENLH
jgi:hypothetical protein